ncbi:MAG: PhoH family protein [Nitrospirae bacterium]|nr:PhoH family protein [Nitrospirota bacterium]MCL5423124.1 PhoH family protein [Nitrospirota bacterium]
MKKVFVLDTNVLIHDPASIFKFENNDIVIPFTVIGELDRHKKGRGEIAASARQALRSIDELREAGSLSSGIRMATGGMISVSLPATNSSGKLPSKGAEDSQIIKTALSIAAKEAEDHKGNSVPVVLVTKDTAVRIKAESLGIRVEDYMNDKTSLFQQYGKVLTDGDNTNGIASLRYVSSETNIYKLAGTESVRAIKRSRERMGISPRNVEQECALDALSDPGIEIVALTGNAGTGKTLLALAAGLHQTAQVVKKTSQYEQVIVSRPIVPMGNDIGYLPGNMEEKLTPWMQPIFDNLEVILNTPKGIMKDNTNVSKMKSYQYLMDAGLLQVEPLTYIRGRSLPKRYFVIDEAQNLRPLDIKTIVTRCGEGTKIVFTGDLDQIDTPYLDKMSNGLAYLISRFINEENFCFLNLRKSVRSRLAEQGARLL